MPKLRPTYAMLLRHPWLAPLTKPETITEEDEDAEAVSDGGNLEDTAMFDPEVGQWVRDSLERKRNGKLGTKAKPALHTAPLDAAMPHGNSVSDLGAS